MPERHVLVEDAEWVLAQAHAAAKAVIGEVRTAHAGAELAQVLMLRIHEQCELFAREALARGPRIACGPGCHWCCRGTVVELSAPEALVIASHLATMNLAGMHARVRETVAETRGMNAEERHRRRIPCPLLDAEGSCSVHPVRPIACRGQSSTCAADCQEGLEHADENRRLRKNVGLLLAQSAVSQGFRAALRSAELDDRVLELSSALDVALSHREAGARWARGEMLFGQAARPERNRPLPPHSKNQRKAARRALRSH